MEDEDIHDDEEEHEDDIMDAEEGLLAAGGIPH
jgi:hypothetical protein